MTLVGEKGFNEAICLAVHLAMISFDQYGNLTPYTCIRLKREEIVKYFVVDFPESTTRPTLYNHFVHYMTNLNHVLNQSVQQWLGGSFISTKLNPNDIDCVNLIVFNERLEQNVDALMPYLLIGGSRDTYRVDGHLIAIYLTTDERYNVITVPSINYWQAFLMNDRQNNPRGIIELIDAD